MNTNEAFEKEPDTKMKKIASAVIGLSLTFAAAGFAAQAPASTQAPATSTLTTKQHVKKHKKAKGTTSATSSTATPAAPAK